MLSKQLAFFQSLEDKRGKQKEYSLKIALNIFALLFFNIFEIFFLMRKKSICERI